MTNPRPSNGYVTNGQISVPLSWPDLRPDVSLNGMHFSYTYGVFYAGVTPVAPIRLPTEGNT